MPIDYLSQRKKREQELSSLVSGRDVSGEISGTRSGIEGRRRGFLGSADELIAGVSPTKRSAIGTRIPELTRKTDATLAKQKYDLQRKMYQEIFNTAFNAAEDYGMDTRSAVAYARNLADQQSGFDFSAREAGLERESALRMNSAQNEYARRGVELQSQYAPDADYGGALMRVLLGTGTMVGTNYLLNRQPNPVRPLSGTTPLYSSDVPSTLRSRSMFSGR